MTCMASSGVFADFTFTAFSPKNIPVVVDVIISPSLIDFSMFFFPIKTTRLCVAFFNRHIVKHITPLWWFKGRCCSSLTYSLFTA